MTELIVADSTCLIGLERIGRLDILPALFGKVIVPPEVSREFSATFDWLETVKLENQVLAGLLLLVVDSGEAEAITLASEQGLRLIADDKQARAVARQLGIEVIGTIGLLIIAKQMGLQATAHGSSQDCRRRTVAVTGPLARTAWQSRSKDSEIIDLLLILCLRGFAFF